MSFLRIIDNNIQDAIIFLIMLFYIMQIHDLMELEKVLIWNIILFNIIFIQCVGIAYLKGMEFSQDSVNNY